MRKNAFGKNSAVTKIINVEMMVCISQDKKLDCVYCSIFGSNNFAIITP